MKHIKNIRNSLCGLWPGLLWIFKPLPYFVKLLYAIFIAKVVTFGDGASKFFCAIGTIIKTAMPVSLSKREAQPIDSLVLKASNKKNKCFSPQPATRNVLGQGLKLGGAHFFGYSNSADPFNAFMYLIHTAGHSHASWIESSASTNAFTCLIRKSGCLYLSLVTGKEVSTKKASLPKIEIQETQFALYLRRAVYRFFHPDPEKKLLRPDLLMRIHPVVPPAYVPFPYLGFGYSNPSIPLHYWGHYLGPNKRIRGLTRYVTRWDGTVEWYSPAPIYFVEFYEIPKSPNSLSLDEIRELLGL